MCLEREILKGLNIERVRFEPKCHRTVTNAPFLFLQPSFAMLVQLAVEPQANY
uniref:Uncharacterized protein n=1 Tax=Anguilla anguilla TaxID=7936 RepID=A0A0E9WCF3_ANGAN